MADKNEILRKLPGVDKMLESENGKKLIDHHGKPAATVAIRKAIEKIRKDILDNDACYGQMDESMLRDTIAISAREYFLPRLRAVINATGVIVHTNLGRAPLADEALEAIRSVATVYSNLEYDVEKGKRGSRQSLIEELLIDLIGCEAAMAVNNNAGAVFLALTALSRDKETIVSRGELVEIGGSFRVPDVMAASGAKMVEVGTTNKTRAADYEAAISENTALLLKVHRSNFYIRGFTEEAGVAELAQLAHSKNLAIMVDLGSGCIIDTAAHGLPKETTPAQTLADGADIVTFSGDKLFGGPQAGIIAGKKDAIEKLKKHPVHRALRIDKATLAALETTLRIYISGKALEKIPVVAMIAMTPDELEKKADDLRKKLNKRLSNLDPDGFEIDISKCVSKVGGGALAEGDMQSWAVTVAHKEVGAEKIFAALLENDPPIVGRIQDNKLFLDVRTLWNVEAKTLIDGVFESLSALSVLQTLSK